MNQPDRPIVENIAPDAAELAREQPVKLRSKPRDSAPDRQALKTNENAMHAIAFVLVMIAVGFFSGKIWGNQGPVLLFALSLFVLSLCLSLSAFLQRRKALARRSKSAHEDHPDLESRNQNLATRLEALEDRSWEIRESEEIHRSLSEAFGDVVLHRDRSGRITFSNGPFDSFFKNSDSVPAPPKDWSIASNEAGVPLTQDIELATNLGKRWFSWTDLLARDPVTGEVGLRSVARDITERKKHETGMRLALEEAQRANETKSRFLAMVSHEIRTPLNGILGMAGLLRDTKIDATQKNYVDALQTSGNTLLALIEDLLDSAKIETDSMELKSKPFNLLKLVEGVLELLAPKAREKGLALACFVDPKAAQCLVADEIRLRQVLINLVGNATKFTNAGGISLMVTLEEDALTRQRLLFEVQDSGPGISEADCEKIFGEFVQAQDGIDRSHDGAGLGLAISQKIIGLMGGEISVKSQLSRGTCFNFPLELEVADVDGALEKPAENEVGNLSKTVGLVMPKSPARKALIQTLAAQGNRTAAFDTMQALQSRLDQFSHGDAVIIASAITEPNETAALKCKGLQVIKLQDAGAERPSRSQFSAWLTWPVRSGTLASVLCSKTPFTEHAEPSVESSLQKNPANSLRILLAEDNAINALLAKSLLAKLGHKVTHVEDGLAAVEAGKAEKFDLMFIDLHMPRMDGEQTIVSLREFEVSTNRAPTPMVVLSADGQSEARENALKSGADDFITKPLDPDALAHAVRKLAA